MLIMVSLITFGLLGMMLSQSDLKMSNKNANWNKRQYELESKGALVEAALDDLLARVEKKQNEQGTESASQLYNNLSVEINTMSQADRTCKWNPKTHQVTCVVTSDEKEDAAQLEIIFELTAAHQRMDYQIVTWRQLPKGSQ
jgi:hypothetical protein